MRRFFSIFGLLLLAVTLLASCGAPSYGNSDTITVENGYLVVNGEKTEYKVYTEPLISVIDGCVAVNGIKTEYEVNTTDVVTVENGYLVVNGSVTEYKVHTEPVISVIDGYVAVNGIKTEYVAEPNCDHEWQTETINPTCTEQGYDIKHCPFCDKTIRTNVVPANSHSFDTTYTSDDQYHWVTCGVCGEVTAKAEHTLNDNSVCTTCDRPLASTPGILYEISLDSTYAEVLGYTGTATNVRIAGEYNGLPVRNIYNQAFRDTQIVSVIIPDSVTSIGDDAFYGCTRLASVVIPEGVTSIGDSAFYSCSSLTSVVIPDGVTSIESSTFGGCSALASVVIPNSVISIDTYAFSRCGRLSSIIMGDNVKSIGAENFYECHPSLYTEYGYCKYLRIGDNPYAFLLGVTNRNMRNYTIHEDTKWIGPDAFAWCSNMASIVIPDSVKSICDEAFYNCTGLSSVHISDITKWCNIWFDGGYSNPVQYARNLYVNGDLVTDLVIPDGVTNIPASAFYGCSLTSVVIPDSVIGIGNAAFYNCQNLTNIIIHSGVANVGYNAFGACLQLTVYCEFESKPAAWDPEWNRSNRPVVWGYKKV